MSLGSLLLKSATLITVSKAKYDDLMPPVRHTFYANIPSVYDPDNEQD
jgi:hypothetical protein